MSQSQEMLSPFMVMKKRRAPGFCGNSIRREFDHGLLEISTQPQMSIAAWHGLRPEASDQPLILTKQIGTSTTTGCTF